jgi:branched-chain amino acid transport system substrate-binding protein
MLPTHRVNQSQPVNSPADLEILAAGGDIDYVGATGVEFNDVGEPSGVFNEFELIDGSLDTVRTR